MIYTKSAAARILETSASNIVSVSLLPNGKVEVEFKSTPAGGGKKVASKQAFAKKVFAADFVNFRKAGAASLISHRVDNKNYQVFNPVDQTSNIVTLGATLSCTCGDYANQIEQFKGQGCCKHNYAILKQWFGLESLSDYVALTQPAATAKPVKKAA